MEEENQTKPELKTWMASHWKAGLAFTYSLIVVFDFIVVPTWLGWHRPSMSELLIQMQTFTPDMQLRIMETAYRAHIPYTLQNSGLVHIAFGALLTGSALVRGTKNE